MIIVGVGGLAVVLIAALVLLLLYGAQQFVDLVSRLFPNWDVLGVPIHIRNFVAGALNGAVHAVEGAFDACAGPIVAVISTPFYVAWSWGEKITDTISEAVTTSRWIITGYIPRVLSSVYSWISTVAGQVRAYTDTRAVWLVSLISTNVDALWRAISQAGAAARAYTDTRTAWLVSLISTNVDALWRAISQAGAAARAYTDTRAVWLVSLISTNVDALWRAITATGAKAEADIAATAEALEHDIGAAYTAAITDTLGVISTDIGHVAQAAWADLDDAVSGAVSVAASDFPDIMQWIKAIPATAITDLAGVTALSTATAGALTRYLEECGMPNCRNLSGVGRALQDLFALFEGGAFLALLAAMIADPKGMAAEVDSVLGPITSGVADTARDLLEVG